MNLVIDDEFKALIPPLSPDEYNQLEASIQAEGCRDALVIWAAHNIIVDGHNRYGICQKHGIPYQTVERKFDSREDVALWMLDNQFGRRNLTDATRIRLALRYKEVLARQAEERMKAGIKHDGPVPNSAQGTGKTRDKLADKAGMGHSKLAQGEKVVNAAPAPLQDKWDAGDISTNRAYELTKALEKLPADHREQVAAHTVELEKVNILARLYKSMGSPETNGTYEEILRSGGFHFGRELEKWCDFWQATIQDITKALQSVAEAHKREATKLRIAARIEEAQTLPPKVYNVIYADPAWQYDNAIASWGPARLHYSDMSIDDICALPTAIDLQIASNAALFLWVTNPFLEDAFKVVTAWGFQYKTNMTWVKTDLQKPGSGFYVRGRHELLFICTRGNFTPLDKHISPPIGSVIEAPLQEHSRKPDEVYSIIERLYPGCNYIELFARRTREGWDHYGNEVEGHSHVA